MSNKKRREFALAPPTLVMEPVKEGPQPLLYSCTFEVFGKVQGVYFRRHTQSQARKLGLHGWCMNTMAGTVKGVAEGTLDGLTDLKYWLRYQGSPHSRIDKADFSPSMPVAKYSYKTFVIRK